jgi:hypothetical protein
VNGVWLRAAAVVLLVTPHAVPAKLMMTTLKELVEGSEVIATGHFSSAPTHRHLTVLTFRLTSVVKGGMNPQLPAEIAFCNPDTDSEYPDFNDADEDFMLFLTKTDRCYSLAWGYKAAVTISNGHAQTSRIDDQPKQQPIAKFIKKIQSVMGTDGKIKIYPILPCKEASKPLPPVARECVAAAVAEQAFLKETHHEISRYTIFAMSQTDPAWNFDIEIGDEDNPPRPGGQYFVRVGRATAKTTITPGE